MSLMKYSTGSAWSATPQTSWCLENLVLRDIPNDPTDRFVVVENKYDQRPYNMAYDIYGSKDYWWVFMVMNLNLIRDPIYDFKGGLRLRIPTKERLLSNIQAVK